jgi:hypothetical protein
MDVVKLVPGKVACLGYRRVIYAAATWAVYAPQRYRHTAFRTHPAVRYNTAGGVDIDQGFVTERMLRSEARRLASQIRRAGMVARSFRVADGKHPGDPGSGWES